MTDQASSTLSIRAILRDEISKSLVGIRTKLVAVRDDFVKLGADVSPIAGRIAAGFAAVAAVAGFRASITAAKDAANAEARLLSALKGRREELEKIKGVALEIQGNSLFEDDELIAQAATLVAMGNAAGKIPDQLQAAVDVAAQFGLELNETVRAIGLFRSGEFGRLGQKVPILKKLKEEGKLASDGVRVLLEQFGGAAAAQAANDFGTIAKLQNEIGNESERIGDVLAKIQATVLKGILQSVKAIADALETPAGVAIVEGIASVAPQLTIASAAVGALIAGTAAWGLAIKPMLVGLKGVVKFLGSVLALSRAVLVPLAGWAGLILVADQVLSRVLLTQEEIAANGTFLAQAYDSVTGSSEELKDDASDIGAEIALWAAGLKAAFEIGGAALQSFIIEPFRNLSFSGAQESFERRMLEISTEAFDEITRTREDSDKKTLDGQRRRLAMVTLEQRAILDEIAAVKKLRAALGQIDDLREIDPDKLRELLQGADAATADALAEVIRGRIERAVDLGTVDAAKALELIQVIDTAAAERRVELARTAVRLAEEQASQAKDAVVEDAKGLDILKARDASLDEITAAIARQSDLHVEFNEKAQEALEAERELAIASADAAKAQERFAAATKKAADSVVQRAEEARKKLDDTIKRSTDLANTGTISESAAIEQQRQALERFAVVMARVRRELDAIAAKFPELAPEIAQARVELEKLNEGIDTLADTSNDFFGGFVEGLRAGSSQLNDLKELGREVGTDLADSIGEGVVDVFIRGRKTFGEWSRDVLLGIIELTAKFLAFKAITAALGIDSTSGLADGVAANVNVTAANVNVNGGSGGEAVAGVADALTGEEEGGFLSTITDGIGGAFDSIKEFLGFGAGDTAPAAGEESAGFLSSLGSFFGIGEEGSFLSSLTSSITGLFTGSGPLSFIGTALSGLGGALGTGGSALLSGLGTVGSGLAGVLGPALAPLTGGLSALLPAILPAIEPLISGLFSGLTDLLPTLLSGLTSFLPSLLSGGGLFEMLASFAPLLLLAEGGPVPGAWTGKDDRLIGVGGGEYVHPADTTQHYGLRAMDAIRRRLVPRHVLNAWSSGGIASIVSQSGFAEGGAVSRAGAGRRAEGDGQVVRAIIAPTEEGADALFRSGERPLMNFIGKHAKAIKSLLGQA